MWALSGCLSCATLRSVWIRIQRLDFVPVARISGPAKDSQEAGFLDSDLMDDLATILREMQADRSKGRRFASIIDLRNAAPLNAKQRAVVGAWVKETRELTRITSISTAFVAPSALLRGVLTAIFWTQSFGVPYRVLATLEDAVAWSLERVRDTGVGIPEGTQQAVLRAFHEEHKQTKPAMGS